MKQLRFGALAIALGCAVAAHAGRNIGYFTDARFGAYGYTFSSELSGLGAALTGDGHTLNGLSTISSSSIAGMDVLYVPLEPAYQGQSSITNAELADLMAFNAAGGEIVWQLENGLWNSSDNDLWSRMGLGITQSSNIDGGQLLADDPHPVMNGPHGVVNPWDVSYAIGETFISDSRVDSLMKMRDGSSALPFVDCGWNGAGSASMFFLMDVNGFENAVFDPNNVNLARNMFEYNCDPVPEPATMAALGLGLAAMVRRRRKA